MALLNLLGHLLPYPGTRFERIKVPNKYSTSTSKYGWLISRNWHHFWKDKLKVQVVLVYWLKLGLAVSSVSNVVVRWKVTWLPNLQQQFWLQLLSVSSWVVKHNVICQQLLPVSPLNSFVSRQLQRLQMTITWLWDTALSMRSGCNYNSFSTILSSNEC